MKLSVIYYSVTGNTQHMAEIIAQGMNLVEGAEAIVESPEGDFEPFVVHYAETFVIPEQVKRYTIRPFGRAEGQAVTTIKAYVRT